ncbi:hypothetical protein [Clostridium sp. CF012]|nr:hypothetical protein [Clostridium sp. CF012]
MVKDLINEEINEHLVRINGQVGITEEDAIVYNYIINKCNNY